VLKAQVSCSTSSLHALTVHRMHLVHLVTGVRAAVTAAALTLVLGGCGSGGASPAPASQSSHLASTGLPVAGSTAVEDIPPGREIAEGGGGPISYTFREEWRRARSAAQGWRSGAYLVSAVGSFINEDGVPSSWTFQFIDRASPDAVLVVEIDPWGKVTATREVTGTGASSLVGPHAGRIPYAVIDSDTAVGVAKVQLASRYDLAKTKDPRIALGFSLVDGSGPYWTYTVFHAPTAAYVSVQVDALTGEVTLPD
jgi:hypothetical protein